MQAVCLARAAGAGNLPGALPELPERAVRLDGRRLQQGEQTVLVHPPLLEQALPRVVHGEERQDRVRRGGLLRDALGDVIRLREHQSQVAAFDHALPGPPVPVLRWIQEHLPPGVRRGK